MSELSRLLPLPLPSAVEMGEWDRKAIEELDGREDINDGGDVLMERAGRAIAERLIDGFPEKTFLILCGSGNNGGDGLVIARELAASGARVSVVLAASGRYSSAIWRKASALPHPLYFFSGGSDYAAPAGVEVSTRSAEGIAALLSGHDIIIEALLGTAQTEAPRGTIRELLKLVTQHLRQDQQLIAVDTPAGCNPSTGEVFVQGLSFTTTYCIAFAKRGLLQQPARAYAGNLECVPLGIREYTTAEFSLLDSRILSRVTPRSPDSHKGSYGRVAIIGSLPRYEGATVLAAHGAVVIGAGLVGLAERSEQRPRPAALWPEVISLHGDAEFFEDLKHGFSTLVMGPGFTHDQSDRVLLREALAWSSQRGLQFVLDAGALTLIAEKGLDFPEESIITPHPGEAAKLLGTTTAEVQRNRFLAARQLAQLGPEVVILKGAGTIIFSRDHGLVSLHGTPALATAGTGDVLAGVLGGLVGQGYSLNDAAALGVYLHARAAEELVRQRKGGPLRASDLLTEIPLHFPCCLS